GSADKFRPQVRPPRLGGNEKIGVFATRSMYRPSPIGLSVVKLNKVEKVGKSVRVYVTGSDLLNGTPILDIKPYIQYSD
ncbi:SAM-dependent methyltransferase, partial [Acinetobacter sp. 11520]|nr:SAM-dependent methyltransferase [Acinetobacter sp. 11520]